MLFVAFASFFQFLCMLFSWTAVQGIAVTQENSLLDNTARIEGWLARFPMFDWVGGRTSEMSAVGLLPAALQVSDTICSILSFDLSISIVHNSYNLSTGN